jgi:hypothetical protein
MNKFLLAVLIVSAGTIGAARLHQAAEQAQIKRASMETARVAATNELAGLAAMLDSLRAEVSEKKTRLSQLSPGLKIDEVSLRLMEGGAGDAAAWTRLRDQLGIGWDSSAEYLLVSKRVLKQLRFDRIISGKQANNTTCAVLGISAGEQAGIRAALERVRSADWLQVQRAEPSGDVVAQYTIRAPDRAFEPGVSNAFAAEINSVLGSERAALFANQAWREVRQDLTLDGSEPAVLTVRRSGSDADAGFVYELREGKSVRTNEVRYAYYPGGWFLTVFPKGWQSLAEGNGFELPSNFSGQSRRP